MPYKETWHDEYDAGFPHPRIAGKPRPLHPGREPVPAADAGTGDGARPPPEGKRRPRRRAPAGAVAPAPGGRRVAQLHGLRPAAGRPDPGRQRRPHEGGAPLRPRARRAPRVVRAALDPRRDARVHPAQLAAGQGRDDQGAAQAVLQPAQHEGELGGAVGRRSQGDRQGPRRQARRSRRDGNAAGRPRPRARPDAGRRGELRVADRVPDRQRGRARADPRARADGDEPHEGPADRAREARRPQPPHHRGALAARGRLDVDAAGPRRPSTACPPSGSARSRARR